MESDHFLWDFFFYTLSLSVTVEDRIVNSTDVDSDSSFGFIFIYLGGLRNS